MSYETYEEKEEKSRRMVLLVKRVEIEDHLQVSKYNKFLYWPGYETSHEGPPLTPSLPHATSHFSLCI